MKIKIKNVSKQLIPTPGVGDPRGRIKYYLGIFVIGILIVGGAIYILRAPQSAEAEWFNDSWYYRQSIAITNSGSAVTNQYVKIVLDTATLISAGKMQSDCDDLRVTDINGNLLTYFIDGDSEYDCNDSDTAVYAMVNSIPTNGATLYLYYGNPSAENAEALLGSQANPALSCKNILEHGDSNGDGNYYIIPSGNLADQIQVYCDMTNDDGGWMLVFHGLPSEAMVLDTTHESVKLSNNIIFNNIKMEGVNLNFSVSTTVTETAQLTNTIPKYYYDVDQASDGSNPRVNFHDLDGNQDVLLTDNYFMFGYGNTWRVFYTCINVSGIDNLYLGGYTPTCTPRSSFVSEDVGCTNSGYNYCSGNSRTTTPVDSGLGLSMYEYQETKTWVRENNLTLNIDQSAGSPSSEERGPGPVGYWSFDEGYGTTAHDGTSNSNDGTITGATWQTEDQCIAGKCLYFNNASNEYVNVGNDSSLDVSDEFTISTWIKPKETQAVGATIVSKGTVNGSDYIKDQNYMLYLSATREVKIAYGDGTNYQTQAGSTIIANQWHHITVIFNGTNILLYIDGQLDNSWPQNYTPVTGDGTDLYIGIKSYNNSAYRFNGFIDEVKIYPYARTPAQIKADYNAGLAGVSSSQGIGVAMGGQSNKSLSDGLVGYWKMDEDSWSGVADEVVDSSGNGNHGVAVNGATTTSTSKYAMAGEFDGTDDYVNCGNNDVLNPGTDDFSVGMWVKVPEKSSGNYGILTKSFSTAYGIFYTSSNDELGLYAQSGADHNGINISSYYDTWVYVVWVVDNDNNIQKSYLNGVFDNQTNHVVGDITSSSNLNIGRYASGSGYFTGILDEVRIYNRALSAREVTQLYEYAPGPVAYYDFNEKEGTTLYDKSGNENHGTLTNMDSSSAWVRGKYGSGLDFDGSDDYVSGLSLELIQRNSTISWWMLKNNNNSGSIFSKGLDSYSSHIEYRNTSVLRFEANPNNAWIREYSFNKDVDDSQWHHFSLVLGNLNSYLYIDGILSDTQDPVSTAELILNIDDIASYSRYVDYFDGQIDEVRIYNYARTPKQILEDMNGGRPAINSLIGYWKFDNSLSSACGKSDAEVFDSGDVNYNLNGKFGLALDFTEEESGNFTYVDANTLRDSSKSWTTNQWAGYQFIRGYSGSQYCKDTIDSNTATDIVFSSACDSFTGSLAYKIKKMLYVDAPMPDQPTDQISGSLWFKSNGSHSARIARAENEAIGFSIASNYVGAFVVHYTNQIEYTTSPHDNQWHYLATTWDGSVQKLYYDGKLVNSGDLSDSLSSSKKVLKLGARNDGNNEHFNGFIDEVKIWNYGLTAEEVYQDYNQGKAVVLGSGSTESDGETFSNSSDRSYCVPGDTATCNPPIAEWKFDEKTGTTAYDTSGNGYDGTLINGPTWTRGKVGSALEFDGEDDYIRSTQNLDFNINAGNWTASVWEYIDKDAPYSNWATILGVGDQYTQGFHIFENRVCTYSDTPQAFCVSFQGALTNYNWHFITATHNLSSKTITAYVDGVEYDSVTYTGTLPDTTNRSITSGWRGTSSDYFIGKLDQARIYDYARTPAQIAWEYNKGASIAHWSFDEKEGAIAHDETNNLNHGTLTNMDPATDWLSGSDCVQGGCLDFDGSGYINCVSGETFNLSSRDWTYSFWAKTSVDDNHRAILSQGLHGNNGQWEIYRNYLADYIRWAGTDDSGTYKEFSTDMPNDNIWRHYIFQRDGDYGKVYVNGVLKTNKSVFPGLTYNSNYDLAIGAINAGSGGWYWDGSIDEVKIYNYALTPLQIRQEYNLGQGIYFK
jgi:hypothetical protein